MIRSKLVQQVIDKVMLDGKKSTAERIVYDALAILSERTGKDPVEALETSIKALTPVLEVRSRRVGSTTCRQVPVEVPQRRAHARRPLARLLRPLPPRALDGAAPGQRAPRRPAASRAARTSGRTTSSAWRRPTRPSRTTAGSLSFVRGSAAERQLRLGRDRVRGALPEHQRRPQVRIPPSRRHSWPPRRSDPPPQCRRSPAP